MTCRMTDCDAPAQVLLPLGLYVAALDARLLGGRMVCREHADWLVERWYG
jgi:hypothetical protein